MRRSPHAIVGALAALAIVTISRGASAQGVTGLADVVASCGTPNSTYVAGAGPRAITQDTTGTLCSQGGGGGGGVSSVHGTAGEITSTNPNGPTVTLSLPATITSNETGSGTWNFTGTFEIGGTAETFPGSGLIVGTTDTQTLSGKTLTSPTINGAALSGTLTGAPTASGAWTFSGVPLLTGLSAGTQVSCLGLDSGNHIVTNAASCGSGGGSSGANPTATAGPTAVNGSATTFLRSDGAPAVQKGSSAQFGIMECDNVTVTCPGGVLSSVGGAATAITVGTTSVVSGTGGDVEFNNGGTLGEKGVTGTGSVVLATSPSISTPAVTGGTIDNTVIGGTTKAAGNFTTLGATGTITTAGGSISSTLDTQPAFVPTGTAAPTNGLYLETTNEPGIEANSRLGAVFNGTAGTGVQVLFDGLTSVLNAGDRVSIGCGGTGGNAGSCNLSARNGSANSAAVEDFYLGNNTSATEFSITVNSSANTGGNGDNSSTINGTGGLWLQGNATNALAIATNGNITLSNQASSGTTTDYICTTSAGLIVSTATACTSGSGTLDVTDGTHSVTSTTTLTFGNGFVIGGSAGSATANVTVPNATQTTSYQIAAADMAGQENFNGSSLTATIPAISSTVFANGMSSVITNRASTAVTLSSTPTLNGLASATTIYQYGWANCTSNGVSLDCYGFPGFGALSGGITATGAGVVTLANPSASTLGGIESIVSASHEWIDSISTAGVPHQSQPAFTDISGTASATQVPAAPLPTPGTSITLTGPKGYAICTSTCSVTLPTPATGYEFCAMNDDNVSTVITIAGIASVQFEVTARTSFKSANTSIVSGGAVGDKICFLGRDSTHYLTPTYMGTWS